MVTLPLDAPVNPPLAEVVKVTTYPVRAPAAAVGASATAGVDTEVPLLAKVTAAVPTPVAEVMPTTQQSTPTGRRIPM
jgi:aminoglycoside phosphotransferase (APT) family kinase protein